jgi:hypothetical protein
MPHLNSLMQKAIISYSPNGSNNYEKEEKFIILTSKSLPPNELSAATHQRFIVFSRL